MLHVPHMEVRLYAAHVQAGAGIGLGPWAGMSIAALERGLGGVLIGWTVDDRGNGVWGS
jgi:hypothetical protein